MATYRIVDTYSIDKPINGVHYDSWGAKNVFNNRGESDYFVDDVIVLDKNFSKIGDIVKGTNKTAPHDTLYVKIVK